MIGRAPASDEGGNTITKKRMVVIAACVTVIGIVVLAELLPPLKEWNLREIMGYVYDAIVICLMAYAVYFFVNELRSKAVSKHAGVKDSTNVFFDDIAGLEELKEELRSVIDLVKQPEKCLDHDIRLPKGILLTGEPGNGKTMLAKALAQECGVSFIAVNASDYGGLIIGRGSEQVKGLFAQARKQRPCIIFIDEIDAMGMARRPYTDNSSADDGKTVTTLLTEMDGFAPDEGVIVIAATNRPETLDKALMRPGRFDKSFVVPNPDLAARLQLFEFYGKRKKFDASLNKEELARSMSGSSCAEIESIINEAAIEALKSGSGSINKAAFDRAILKLQMHGHENGKQVPKSKQKLVAYHEAGHAVIGKLMMGMNVGRVSAMTVTSGSGGYTYMYCEDSQELPSIAELENRVLMLYAGRAAEYVLGGEKEAAVTVGASTDIEKATELIHSLCKVRMGSGILERDYFGFAGERSDLHMAEKMSTTLWKKAVDAVKVNWTGIRAVASALEETGSITGEKFNELLSCAMKMQCIKGNTRMPKAHIRRVQNDHAHRKQHNAPSSHSLLPNSLLCRLSASAIPNKISASIKNPETDSSPKLTALQNRRQE